MALVNSRVDSLLACPIHRIALTRNGSRMECSKGHFFAVEEGIPLFTTKPRREPRPLNMAPCQVDEGSPVDPFVNDWIVNTNGNLYCRVRGRLPRYPIPQWPFGEGKGRILVDLGCGWGRWCIAAAGSGYSPVGVDVHLDAVQAANRIAPRIGTEGGFVCAEVDALPFLDSSADVVFSYSVLQHVERRKVASTLQEA